MSREPIMTPRGLTIFIVAVSVFVTAALSAVCIGAINSVNETHREARSSFQRMQGIIEQYPTKDQLMFERSLQQLADRRAELTQKAADPNTPQSIAEDLKLARSRDLLAMEQLLQKCEREADELADLYMRMNRDHLDYFDPSNPEHTAVLAHQQELRKTVNKSQENVQKLKASWENYKKTDKWIIPG